MKSKVPELVKNREEMKNYIFNYIKLLIYLTNQKNVKEKN